MSTFVFLHGWQGSEPGHWQRLTAAALAERGHDVRFPDFPDPDRPEVGPWLERLEQELLTVDPAETTVLTHSLGCYLWLQHARTTHDQVDRVLLVAPPSPDAGETIPELRHLPVPPLDPAAVARAAASTELVHGDDDPYWPNGDARDLADALRIPASTILGGGHVNVAAGYGAWPALVAWCERRGAL